MMKNQLFFVYSKTPIILENFPLIQKLYLPIIGPNAAVFYHNINNIILDNKNNWIGNLNTISSLIKSLNIDIDTFIKTRKLLEALGLMKTYLSNNQKKITFEILPPLTPLKFFKNKLLKNLLLKQIGEIELDTLMHFYKNPQIDMSDYVDISAEFNDLFSLKELVQNNISLTREMQLPIFKSDDEAIEGLTSNMYFKYLMNIYPNPYQIEKLSRFLESGLANPSLNLLLNHSYKKNGAIIFNYIETIIIDFKNRNIKSFINIKNALKSSLKVYDNQIISKINLIKTNRSAEDIFKEMIPN